MEEFCELEAQATLALENKPGTHWKGG